MQHSARCKQNLQQPGDAIRARPSFARLKEQNPPLPIAACSSFFTGGAKQAAFSKSTSTTAVVRKCSTSGLLAHASFTNTPPPELAPAAAPQLAQVNMQH
eukprot:scaffold113894_cov19-Tisochrysis_lutea.AAC.2